ncbi:hypothetical protein E2C01_007207 [Portunus trituberculatus]|uniref:Uncharacterized protein n=1 Tax=Portunus trituberculatus TaxID=210409 RepID=A0A5B7CYC2_PORTR|nr:hypothetical protein [Portunus trituberculatus]
MRIQDSSTYCSVLLPIWPKCFQHKVPQLLKRILQGILEPHIMMSFLRLRDSRDFSPYSSSAEWTDEHKTSLSALSKADVEGPAVAGSARFNGLKKEDIEEGPAVAGSAQGRHV